MDLQTRQAKLSEISLQGKKNHPSRQRGFAASVTLDSEEATGTAVAEVAMAGQGTAGTAQAVQLLQTGG